MPPEAALLESRSMRDSVMDRVEVLDKVRALALLPDGIHATTQVVADFFVVHSEAVKKVAQRHRAELNCNGLQVLRGDDLRRFERDNLSLSNESYPQGRAHLTLYTRRTILNIAMLLRDSEVARQVRTYLLDSEEATRGWEPAYSSLDRRLTDVESGLADVGPVLRELGPVIRRISVRLEGVDRRLASVDRRVDATNRVVSAMSLRISDLAEDVRELGRGPRGSGARRRGRG